MIYTRTSIRRVTLYVHLYSTKYKKYINIYITGLDANSPKRSHKTDPYSVGWFTLNAGRVLPSPSPSPLSAVRVQLHAFVSPSHTGWDWILDAVSLSTNHLQPLQHIPVPLKSGIYSTPTNTHTPRPCLGSD